MRKKKLTGRLLLIGVLLLIIFLLQSRNNGCENYKKHYDKGDYVTAIKLINRCLSKKSIDISEKFRLYVLLQDSYDKTGDYGKIDIDFLDHLSAKDSLNEENLYGINLIRLKYYADRGDFTKAIEIGNYNRQINFRLNREESIEHAFLLGHVGNYYAQTGKYEKAVELGAEVLRVKQGFYTEDPVTYLTSLNNLAGYYGQLGNYQKAIELGEKGLNLIEPKTDEEYIIIMAILSSLMGSYNELGNYPKALELARLSQGLLDKLSGKNSLFEANLFHNLAITYSYVDDYPNAIESGERALALMKKDSKGNALIPVLLSNLSGYYADIGKYKKAIRKSEEALSLWETSQSSYNPDYQVTALNNLGFLYSRIHNHKKANEYKMRSLEIVEEGPIQNPLLYSSILSNIGLDYLMLNNFSESSCCMNKANNILKTHIKEQFKWLSEREREFVWNKSKLNFLLLPSFSYYSGGYAPFAEMSYDAILLSKGMLLQSSVELNKLLMENGDTRAIDKANELRSVIHTLHRLYEKPISERLVNTDSLERIANKLEKELLAISKEYGDYTRFLTVTWQDVQKKLNNNDVAVEFVEFPVLKSDSVMYAAFLLREDWDSPRMIPLFEEKQIEQYFRQQDPDKRYSGSIGKELYKLMWKRLEEVVAPGDNVFFSASGVFHRLALEYLPSNDGIPLCDIYRFHRLSSTRQLVIGHEGQPYKTAVLYGGIQYDAGSSEMLSESRKYLPEESLYAYRGLSGDAFRGSRWAVLTNTVPEVSFISAELSRNHITTAVYSGVEANEESIKALSGKDVNILHLATHGFFLPIEESRKVNYFQLLGRGDNPTSDLSMRRSGLIMAGGNKAWSGAPIPPGVDDGILTAQEISVLDFRGMDLVVLSACETGLGDIHTSEGVFGLQRAFKKAGVNTLIMSLWKVNDDVTKALMNKFYQYLLQGKSKRDAFSEARRFIRANHPDPRDWAAFVMLD